MTTEECRAQEFPHNHRCRYTHGFQCEDCNTFFPRDSDDYIRYEYPHTVEMSLHNLRAKCVRNKIKVPRRLTHLIEVVRGVPQTDAPKARAFLLNQALVFLGSAGIADPESNTRLILK